MRNVIKSLVLHPKLNYILSRSLRPFSRFLPSKLKIPVHSFFKVKVTDKTSFFLEGHYTSPVSKILFWQGIKGFEYGSVRVFKEVLKDSNVFIDVGANIGYYSIFAAKCNNNLQVYAFEPFPDAIKALKRNMDKNDIENITVIDYALSDKEGTSDFYYRINPGYTHQTLELAGDNSLVNYKNDEREKLSVKITTLDEFVSGNMIKEIDLIKIDTETTEHLVLKGANHTISKFRPIILCEVLKGFHETEIQDFFSELNYSFFEVNPDSLKPCSSLSKTEKEKNDFFFVPTEKTALIQKFV